MSESFGNLPGMLGEIAEVTDLEAALLIADHVGGTRVDIPARAKQGHWLVALIGFRRAEMICDHFRTFGASDCEMGVKGVIIPKGPTGTMAQARQRFYRLRQGGLSVREAARRSGVHERSGFRYNAKAKECDEGQPDLF